MKSPRKTWPRSSGGIENGSGAAPKAHAQALLDHHGEAEGESRLRIGSER
jgi:hypothetical protein